MATYLTVRLDEATGKSLEQLAKMTGRTRSEEESCANLRLRLTEELNTRRQVRGITQIHLAGRLPLKGMT